MDFQSFDKGVAHSDLCASDESILSPLLPRWFGPPFSPSEARAVGHIRAATCNEVIAVLAPPFMRAFIARCASKDLLSSCATAVGQHELSMALMTGAHVGRSKSSPLRIEPHGGKFSEYDSSCWKSEDCRNVFDIDPSRFSLPNDPGVLEEESGAVAAFDPFALSGHGEVLAREPASDSIHKPAPRLAVEGSDVRPHRRVVESLVCNARRQNAGRLNFPLDVADAASVRQSKSDGELKTSGSAEEADVVGT